MTTRRTIAFLTLWACSPVPEPTSPEPTSPEPEGDTTSPVDPNPQPGEDSDPPSPLPTGERVVHADGGVYDTTGAYQLILREPIVCYLIQEVDLLNGFNILAIGIDQQLVHIVGENYRWSRSPGAGYEAYARMDLNYDGTKFLVGGREGAQIVDLISGESEELRTGQVWHAAWVGDGMLLDYNLFTTVDGVRQGTGVALREVGRYTAGYLDRLYGADLAEVQRESLDGGRDRTTHRIPNSIYQMRSGFDQFDVIEQYLILWARRDDYRLELVKLDGVRGRELGSFQPILDGVMTGVACIAGDAR